MMHTLINVVILSRFFFSFLLFFSFLFFSFLYILYLMFFLFLNQMMGAEGGFHALHSAIGAGAALRLSIYKIM